MISYEDYITEQLWYLHKSPRRSMLGIIAHPRDLATEKRIRDIPMHLRDFRYHGYPEENFIQPKMSEKIPLRDLENFQNKQSDRNEYLYEPSNPEVTRGDLDERFSRKFIEEYFKQNKAEDDKIPVEKKEAATVLVDHFPEKRAQDVKRIERERREAEEDIARFKEEQRKKLLEEAEEKKKEYERQTKFYFWDHRSYGHGAPKGDGDHRKHKFVEGDLSPRNQQHPPHVPKGLHESVERYGGSGAPLRTESGSLKTQFKTHPAEQLQTNGNIPQALHEQLKYSQNFSERDQYGKELLRQRQERELYEQEQRIQELKKEIDVLKGNDPFGKPGGGAPNRSHSDSFTERKENSYLRVEDEKKTMPAAGASPRRRLPAEQIADPYFPFGRPGGGAPIIDIEGNVITGMRNKLERNTTSADERRKARAARVYYQELKQEEAELKRQRQQMSDQMKAPEVELASLMKEGQVGKPRRDPITGMLLNQHLPLSDVSKVKMNAQYRDLEEQRMYHDDLTKQADDRHRLRELNRLKEKQQSKQHYDVMGDYWGRYGGGAPKDPVNRRKAALDSTLYSPGRELEYVRPRKDELNVKSEEYNGKISPLYVRNVVNSTHKNQYDFSEDKSNRPYRQGAPYATFH